MKFQQIARKATKRRRQASEYVRFLQGKKGYTVEGYGFLAVQSNSTHEYNYSKKVFVPTTTRPKYVTIVTVIDSKLNCMVSCSCADFKYRWEVALTVHDSAEVEYSNGRLPVIRNPNLEPRCCKHLYRLYRALGPQIDKLKPINPKKRKK